MIGSGISLAICKSVPCSRQITMPAPHHSVFYKPDALPAAQPTASKHWRQSTEGSRYNNLKIFIKQEDTTLLTPVCFAVFFFLAAGGSSMWSFCTLSVCVTSTCAAAAEAGNSQRDSAHNSSICTKINPPSLIPQLQSQTAYSFQSMSKHILNTTCDIFRGTRFRKNTNSWSDLVQGHWYWCNLIGHPLQLCLYNAL